MAAIMMVIHPQNSAKMFVQTSISPCVIADMRLVAQVVSPGVRCDRSGSAVVCRVVVAG
jgi:hypothetical protein